MAAQRIVACPLEALERARHLIRYVRHAPEVGLHYKSPSEKCGRWEQLKYPETATSIDAYSDASFAADDQCRSFGCTQLFWGGAMIAWSAGRQTLLASHTAECELYSLAEAHLLGKAMRPTIAALMGLGEAEIDSRLYCDNAAAIQLCVLEAGSWRTRHLRLRGAVARQDLESGSWRLTHLDGVFMPADIGTKPIGPSRLTDLIKVCDLWAPHLADSSEPPRPQVASLNSKQSEVAKALLALLFLVQISGAAASNPVSEQDQIAGLLSGFVTGVGIGCGWWFSARLGDLITRWCCRRRPVSIGPRSPRAGRKTTCTQTDCSTSQAALEEGERNANLGSAGREGSELLIDGVTADQLAHLWEQLAREQAAENRASVGSSRDIASGLDLRALQGVVDRSGSPEVYYPSGLDAVGLYWASEVAQGSGSCPPADMVATAKAPTVPPPPNLPYDRGSVGRVMYVDDEVVDGGVPVADDPDSGSSSEEDEGYSTIGEWSTDSGMPRGPSSGSQGSGGARSLAGLSLAASVRSAAGHRTSELEEVGSWELGVLVSLVGVACVLLGVVCTLLCIRLWARPSPSGVLDTEGFEGPTPRQKMADRAEGAKPETQASPQNPLQFSPVVNITLKTGGLKTSECAWPGDHPVDLSSGLVPVDPKERQEEDPNLDVDPSGLGLSRTPAVEVEFCGGAVELMSNATHAQLLQAAQVPQ